MLEKVELARTLAFLCDRTSSLHATMQHYCKVWRCVKRTSRYFCWKSCHTMPKPTFVYVYYERVTKHACLVTQHYLCYLFAKEKFCSQGHVEETACTMNNTLNNSHSLLQHQQLWGGVFDGESERSADSHCESVQDRVERSAPPQEMTEFLIKKSRVDRKDRGWRHDTVKVQNETWWVT